MNKSLNVFMPTSKKNILIISMIIYSDENIPELLEIKIYIWDILILEKNGTVITVASTGQWTDARHFKIHL